MGKESKWAKGQDRLLFFTPWQSQTSSEQQEKQTAGSKWAKSQNGPRVIMGFCYLPLKESKWGKDHYRLLLFTPWQSETSSEQQERNKQQGQNGQRVKMGFCYLPPERVKMGLLLFTPWQSQTNSEQQEKTNSRVKIGKESKWAKGQDRLLFFTPW